MREKRTSENVNLCGRENAMRAKEIQTGVRIRSPVYKRSRFQNLALKEKKRKKSPRMRTPTQVQYVSQMCISILRIVP